jgi:light-regulated signal transduction histidine kinase (bacteriophytochrome)
MYKGRPAIIGTLVDITEQVRAEDERTGLFHMLTHDIKGPLTIITGYAELLKSKLEDKVEREMAESICRASDRIYELSAYAGGHKGRGRDRAETRAGIGPEIAAGGK